MGKRSKFEKNKRDYYRTFDPKAGKALEPYVTQGSYCAEPFAGAGDLLDNVHYVHWDIVSDIEPQPGKYDIDTKDAFSYTEKDMEKVELLISNPPWTKAIFHKILDHFVPMIDCWFLMSANWKQNKGSAEYVDRWLTDIVPVGRMQWIENSEHSALDDCEWLKFSANKSRPARFHPRKH